MRAVRGILALTYGLAFVVACLGGCMAPSPDSAHACCAGEPGLRAPAVDCCQVVSGVSGAALTTAQPVVVSVAHLPRAVDVFSVLAGQDSRAVLSPSPPPILRI